MENSLAQIKTLYKLLNSGFKFQLDANNSLQISNPKNLAEDIKSWAKNFIINNKTFIINLLKKNKSQYPILALDLSETILSFAQERLFFIEQYEGNSSVYNTVWIRKLKTTVDKITLKRALQSLITRHDILRTYIKINSEGQGYQEVGNFHTDSFDIAHHYLENKKELSTQLAIDSNYVFNLKNEYPIHLSFYELGQSTYISIVIHHIAFDGWSGAIFLRDLETYYKHFSTQEPLLLPEIHIQYRDFSVWQREYITDQRLLEHRDYWIRQLADYENLNFPTDKLRPKQYNYTGNDVFFSIKKEVVSNLKILAKELGVSLFTILLSAFNLFLRSYTHQNDIIVGTPIANRHYKQLENVVGFFVNSLVLRSKICAESTVSHYILEVSKMLSEAQHYQELPFEKLVDALKIEPDESRHPLFQVMFVLQSFDNKIADSLFEKATEVHNEYSVAKFDLTVSIDEQSDGLEGCFNYATSLFDIETIEQCVVTYQHILSEIIEKSHCKIKHLRYLDKATYQKVIFDWNQTARSYSNDKTIVQLFEAQVERTPHHEAVIYNNVRLTYLEVNQRSNQIAHYLRNIYIVQKDDCIALCLERSEILLIVILGVLKAGATYVPLDPAYSDEYINYIFNDTQTKVLISQQSYYHRFAALNLPLLIINSDEWVNKIVNQSVINPSSINTSNDLIYIIYTSGTTGKPKGVALEHHSIVNRIQWMHEAYSLTENDNILQKTPYVFDVSVWELFWGILYGAKITFAEPEKHKEPHYLIDLIQKEKVSIIHFVPSMLTGFLHVLKDESDVNNLLKSLRYIFCSGEPLHLQQVKAIHHLLPQVKLYNLYGPTEAAVDVSAYFCEPELKKVMIGKPIFNATFYILDSYLNPVPVGGIGELYIGGAGLARGYLNQSELTSERFIFSSLFHTRLYKTGDLVRYLSNGNVEYIGRNDFQVKIRGFRIELEAIETRLCAYPGIKQAVVLAQYKDSRPIYLVGYYVADTPFHEGEILEYLSHHLADYMRPNMLVFLPSFPLTMNGKLDRKALPIPEFSHSDVYIAARSEIEQRICSIYTSILADTTGNKSLVGANSDFFKLGGNSILAIQVAHRISKIFNTHLSVASIFQTKTPAKLAQLVSSNYGNNIHIQALPNIDKYPLSYAQERLWFIEQYEQGNSVYRIPLLLKLSPLLLEEALTNAIQAIVFRHEVLRTIFVQDSSGKESQKVSLDILKIQTRFCQTFELYQSLVKEDIKKSFDLRHDYPIRVCLYKINSEKERYLLINIHHIATDGWSMDIFQKELLAYYNYYNKNIPVSLPVLHIQYKDFSVWQRDYLTNKILTKQLKYWQTRLLGYETLHLPTDKKRPAQVSYEGDVVHFHLPLELSDKLNALSQHYGYTLYTVLLTGFYVLLYNYSGQKDLIVGSVTANRHFESIKDLIGCFINMLVQREQLDVNQSMHFLMEQVHTHLMEAQSHQDISFEKLVHDLVVERDTSRHPLFQVMFTLQSFGRTVTPLEQLFQSVDMESIFVPTRFDLECFIEESNSTIKGSMVYATSLFHKSTIKQFVRHYLVILTQIADNPKKPLTAYHILNSEEYQKIVYDWNQTQQDYPIHKTLHQLFEEQVIRTPNNIALEYEKKTFTYQALNEKSNQLAHYLINTYAIQDNDLIALCVGRSEHMLIAILGILKAGGAYVPIDPAYPEERIRYIVESTQAKVILSETTYHDKLKNNLPMVLMMDSEILECQLVKQILNNPSPIISSNNLAYVIFTSGTTGKPKGVSINHRGALNTVIAVNERFQINEKDKILALSGINFDLSVYDIFGLLAVGGTICFPASDKTRDPAHWVSLIQQYKITIWNTVPQLANLLIQEMKISSVQSNKLRLFLLSGDWIPMSLPTEIKKICCARVISLGGATEGSIWSIWYEIKQIQPEWMSIPYGFPMPNQTMYVLNAHKTPCAVSVIGEIYIGGLGVALNYWGDEKKTAFSFIEHPVFGRLYKTGDLGRWSKKGYIELIGRNDFQVKIRGFRIELAEIENQLLMFPQIKQAVVIVFGEDNQYLVGYYVADKPLNENSILSYLSKYLADYMMPNILMHILEFPLTINGKLDRNALPVPEIVQTNDYIAPTNEIEDKICLAYANLLMLQSSIVGIKSDFFKLGGNSLLAIRLAHAISKIFDVYLNVAEIFQFKTPEKIAALIVNMNSKNFEIKPAQTIEKYPLSFAQERLWFIEQYEQGNAIYQIPFLLKLKNQFSLKALTNAIEAIVARHEILRTIFLQDENGVDYQQKLEDADALKIPIVSCNTFEEYQSLVNEEILKPFNLRHDYPIRICLYEITVIDIERYLLFNFHHVAFDGWSIDIFQQELLAYYNYYNEGRPLTLSNLPIQYKDFAWWQRNYLVGEKLDNQLNYWKKRLLGFEKLNLPTDKKRPKKISYEGAVVDFCLSKVLSKKLRKLSKDKGYTLYTILLTGFYILLHKYSGQNDITVGCATANRHYEAIKDLIGFFVNMLVLREKLNLNESAFYLIKQVHENLIKAQNYQDLPFEKLVQELNIERDGSIHPLFQVTFAVQKIPQVQKDHPFYSVEMKENLRSVVARFDLECFIDDSLETMKGAIIYSTNLYYKNTIESFVRHYQNVLSQMVDSPYKSLNEYYFLSKSEYKKIVIDWNNNFSHYPKEETIPQLFEKKVKEYPYNLAVVYENKKFTYAELNRKVNQLANYLRSNYKIRDKDLISICFERSEKMLIAILAILKVGAAYVPIDPHYPKERISFILKETQSKLVLTTLIQVKHNRVFMELHDVSVLCVDESAIQEVLSQQSDFDPVFSVMPHNLAYVIFTSGTTGSPKGVMIEHHSIVNYIHNIGSIVTSKDIIDFSTNIAFDLTVTTTIAALCLGAKIVVFSDGLQDIVSYKNHLLKNQISFIKQTPSYFDFIIDFLPETMIKKIILGGEKLSTKIIEKIHKACNIAKYEAPVIYDEYGPTETTVGACISKKNLGLTIGRPFTNVTTYVLNESLCHLPIGVVGELYIGGEGLARGYLNQPELTAERFILNPFQTEEERIANRNGYLYKTGDLVRYLSNGEIEYIGRNDFQVKIQGYRVELQEIEEKLITYEGVKKAILVVQQSSDDINQYLVGYYTAEKKLNESAILDYLKKYLPTYMIPNLLIYLDKLPLTLNGKLDRGGLPPANIESNNSAFVLPKTRTEILLAALWSKVLNLKACLCISTSFFALGGTSLSAMILLAKINTTFKIEFMLKDLFENFTIRHIAEKIESKIKTIWTPLVPVNIQDKAKIDLYILPGIIGCSSAYYPLANLLSHRYSVKIIEAKGLYGDSKPHVNIQELLTDYFVAINNEASQKNIILIAHSSGCKQAVGLCAQLEKVGYMVQVVLIDGPSLKFESEDFMRENTDETLLSAIKTLYALSDLENIFDHSESSTIQKIADYLFADPSINNNYKLKIANGFLNVFNAQIFITDNYKPINIRNKAQAIYIACADHIRTEEVNSYETVFEKVSMDVSSGGHLTMLDKYHVSELVDRIINLLKL